MAVHLPVMVREVVELLRPHAGGMYVDATVGPGGHSEELLRHIGDGRLLCLDRDADALERARKRLDDNRCVFRKAKFSEIRTVLKELDIQAVDGVLMDLGISMVQMKFPGRGFSFQSDERLDMRMDRDEPVSARDIVNTWSEKELARIIWEYGEERHSRKIARWIVQSRKQEPIDSCRQLADIVSRAVPGRGKTHPATRTFQALRIAVNHELEELRKGLGEALASLAKGGRMAVISYHSLEDRTVKQFIREEAREGRVQALTKKPVTPDTQEMRENPSARSAKLRALEVI